MYAGSFLGSLKVPLLVLKIYLCRKLRCPTDPEGDNPHLPELCLNGASQHFLVDIMNNAAPPLQLRRKDFLVFHHKFTSTAACQWGIEQNLLIINTCHAHPLNNRGRHLHLLLHPQKASTTIQKPLNNSYTSKVQQLLQLWSPVYPIAHQSFVYASSC